jgi:hypothetical protein
MIDLTDAEARRVIETVERVRVKHMDGSDITGDKLSRLQRELAGRLEDEGFITTVDVSPLLEGEAPSVRIDARIDEFIVDVERKRHDVLKRVERGEDAPDIEGLV